ncbi:MATE family efflux transporter [Paraglaciecola aestuariivivens]
MNKNNILSNFFQLNLHHKILLIAVPMVLSNITTPLMGLVDTAVLGHMNGTHILAGASVAALIVTQLYWLCGFIRMTSTGLSAQAKGSKNPESSSQALFQGAFVSVILGSVLWLAQDWVLALGLYFANASFAIEEVIIEYFQVRIFGAPAAMLNLAVVGWLIGQQKTKQVLSIQVLANLLNIGLNLWFVFGLQLNVKGVALATVLAEYFISIASVLVALRVLGKVHFRLSWFSWVSLSPLLQLNGHTFVRNLVLQACIAFLIFKGVGFGATSAAINAIMLQFFTLIALGLDGIAYAAEALVGEQKGQNNANGIKQVTLHGLVWSSVVAILYSLSFYWFGQPIMHLLTDQSQLHWHMQAYLPFVYWLPLVAHWCFFFDGIFVGLSRAKAMKNTMLLSALLVFFPVFYGLAAQQNFALWIAMLMFMLARGISLGGYFIYLYRSAKVAG